MPVMLPVMPVIPSGCDVEGVESGEGVESSQSSGSRVFAPVLTTCISIMKPSNDSDNNKVNNKVHDTCISTMKPQSMYRA